MAKFTAQALAEKCGHTSIDSNTTLKTKINPDASDVHEETMSLRVCGTGPDAFFEWVTACGDPVGSVFGDLDDTELDGSTDVLLNAEGDAEITGIDLEKVGDFKVTLSSVGNPDRGQSPGRSLPGVKKITLVVRTMKEASEACQKYIAANDLGGGNWSGGDIICDDKIVARVSYNGRVWLPENRI